jgi:hypothetical protein
MLDFIPEAPPPSNPVGNNQDLPKEMDIFYRDELEFLPPGKTLADLTPEELKALQDKYRFDMLRPAQYQGITGFRNSA